VHWSAGGGGGGAGGGGGGVGSGWCLAPGLVGARTHVRRVLPVVWCARARMCVVCCHWRTCTTQQPSMHAWRARHAHTSAPHATSGGSALVWRDAPHGSHNQAPRCCALHTPRQVPSCHRRGPVHGAALPRAPAGAGHRDLVGQERQPVEVRAVCVCGGGGGRCMCGMRGAQQATAARACLLLRACEQLRHARACVCHAAALDTTLAGRSRTAARTASRRCPRASSSQTPALCTAPTTAGSLRARGAARPSRSCHPARASAAAAPASPATPHACARACCGCGPAQGPRR
jgi:hypothetical protein